jgi:pimeloyl-ACP methyl ester carboxylesterase
MPQNRRREFVHGTDVTLEVYVDGTGPALVVLRSYGRDGGADYDYFASKVGAAGFTILRPQPRGIASSKGTMEGVTLHDLAADIALVIRELGHGKTVVLGHAFGNGVARMIAVDHPAIVQGIILAAAQCSSVAPEISKTPHQACDLTAPVEARLAALTKGFLAPNHDASIWLDGWYPETMRMQVNSVGTVPASEFWAAGSAPVLEIIPDVDPFKPRACWGELRHQLGSRVTTEIVANASHALFPEQPDRVADVVIAWCRRLMVDGQKESSDGPRIGVAPVIGPR